jgi:hypothetical protein
LLYFARPNTRLDYLLAKLSTVAFFGALGALLPGLVICTVAAFASPEWSFVKEQGDVIPESIAFGCVWTLLVSSVVLCVSSLASRRTFALIGVFAWFLLIGAVAGILAKAQGDMDFLALSPTHASVRVAGWIFGLHDGPRFSLAWAWTSVATTIAAGLGIAWWRIRKMEIVA